MKLNGINFALDLNADAVAVDWSNMTNSIWIYCQIQLLPLNAVV